ncbi:unnamed protein product [Ceratitis capitata]|uniref:(Mediterranean fruit fly) hypothetical protein n=1 Tax=Ceratitis capitata TaxID=7213 RepID=A0A811VMT3_CERCA|nr:unnamed protein product [Ceratitis capitata]
MPAAQPKVTRIILHIADEMLLLMMPLPQPQPLTLPLRRMMLTLMHMMRMQKRKQMKWIKGMSNFSCSRLSLFLFVFARHIQPVVVAFNEFPCHSSVKCVATFHTFVWQPDSASPSLLGSPPSSALAVDDATLMAKHLNLLPPTADIKTQRRTVKIDIQQHQHAKV